MAATENPTLFHLAELERSYAEPGLSAGQAKEDRPHHQGVSHSDRGLAVRVMATSGRDGLDTSPRGDPKGFVRVSTTRPSSCRPPRQQPHRQPAQSRPPIRVSR
jgi:hypothetical protein